MSFGRAAPEDDTTSDALKLRLERAVSRAAAGIGTLLPTEARATRALRLIGAGGFVSFSSPATVRRAVTLLENSEI